MNKAIVLPDGTLVPATPGKYRMSAENPPDLNEVGETESQFYILEYNSPFLMVHEMAAPSGSVVEQVDASGQARNWRVQHPHHGGFIGNGQAGYQFNELSRSGSFLCQLIPEISYIEAQTWAHLTGDEKKMAFKPCVPVVVIELLSAETEEDQIADLQEKLAKFIQAGTREGVIVDTRRDRVWIHNHAQQQPGCFVPLAPIAFDAWPGFMLDCVAIRDARIQELA